MVLEEDVTDILSLVVWAVASSPACWTLTQCHEHGFYPRAHTCPDHATFDIWLERPDTGWYQMMQEAGVDGYDGIHAAWAIELDDAWLSWNDSSDSLAARLTRHEP